MPYCPKCEAEYEKGYITCNTCRVELVDELQKEVLSEEIDLGEAVFLINISERLNAEMIQEYLEDKGIPVMVKYEGTAGYLNLYMGSSFTGTELYVSESQLEKAKSLLEDSPFLNEIDDENLVMDEEFSEMDEAVQVTEETKFRFSSRMVFLMIFLPSVAVALLSLILKIF